MIDAYRIYSAWNAFLIAIGSVTGERITMKTRAGKTREMQKVLQPSALTDEAEHLMEKLFSWIRSSYGQAYKAIKTDEEMAWLKQVIRFVVYQKIMENKYHQWITSGQGFVDDVVAQKMAEIYRFRSEMASLAHLIHTTLLVHKGREAEEWEKRRALEIITGIADKLRVDRLGALPPLEKS